MAESIRWGILGPGRIARNFTADLVRMPDAAAVAVGARRVEAANAFADEFGIARRHASYEALLADPDVDAVYVAVPHPWHAEWSMKALEAGKAVLCEKPLTVNAAEARELVAAARRTGRFLMEAMWTRFLPCMVRARELVAQGALGEVRFLVADLGGPAPKDPNERWYSADLAGGSLLDMGIYPVSIAWDFLGRPSAVHASATLGPTGVDLSCSVSQEYSNGARAILGSTFEVQTSSKACVSGTLARIEFDGRTACPQGARLVRGNEVVEELPIVPASNGMHFEAAEVGRCLREGLLESPLMPLDQSVAIMESLDEMRRQIGLRYPFER
jgi:predicted dehydrogenase